MASFRDLLNEAKAEIREVTTSEAEALIGTLIGEDAGGGDT